MVTSLYRFNLHNHLFSELPTWERNLWKNADNSPIKNAKSWKLFREREKLAFAIYPITQVPTRLWAHFFLFRKLFTAVAHPHPRNPGLQGLVNPGEGYQANQKSRAGGPRNCSRTWALVNPYNLPGSTGLLTGAEWADDSQHEHCSN